MHTQVWKGIRDVLVADGTLTALLGSGANGVYVGDIPDSPTLPCLRLWTVDDGNDESITGVGKSGPLLQIDIFGTDPKVNADIAWRLEQTLDIPRSRDIISTTNYTVQRLTLRSGRHRFVQLGRGGAEKDAGVKVEQLVTEWSASVIRTP